MFFIFCLSPSLIQERKEIKSPVHHAGRNQQNQSFSSWRNIITVGVDQLVQHTMYVVVEHVTTFDKRASS